MMQISNDDLKWISGRTNKLTDEQIDYFAYLMQLQFGFPLQESWKIQIPELIHPIDANKSHIQLLHSRDGDYDENNRNDPSDHWVCSYYDTHCIYIFDSTYTENKRIHPKWLIVLKRLYPSYDFERIGLKFIPCQKQTNSHDCGIYAIAFATSIIYGDWPTYPGIEYDVAKMRPHLIEMFHSTNISLFPCKYHPNYRHFHLSDSFHCPKDDVKNLPSDRDDGIVKQSSNPFFNVKVEDEKIKIKNTPISVSTCTGEQSMKQEESSPKLPTSQNNLQNMTLQHTIRHGERLNDQHILRFFKIIEKSSDYKPRDTLYLRRPSRIEPVSPNTKHVQILYSSEEHWICCYYDCKKIHIYDSLYARRLHPDHQTFLKHLFPFYNVNDNSVVFCRVQKQSNSRDCGLYAMAFAVSIIFRQKPELIQYDESMMRSHLCAMFENNELLHFPMKENRNIHPNLEPLHIIRTKEQRAESKERKRRARYDHILFSDEEKSMPKRAKLEEDNDDGTQHTPLTEITEKVEKELPADPKKSTNSCHDKKRIKRSKVKKTNAPTKIASKIKKKYRNIEVKQNSLKQHFPNEIYIEKLTDKLSGHSTPERRLEAETMIRWTLIQRKSYVRQLYHTLEILKKKADFYLSKQKKSHTRTMDQLQDLCGESKHSKSNEPYFYETSYVFDDLSEMVIVVNEKGQAVNILPLYSKKKQKNWKCDQFCRILYDQNIVKHYISFLNHIKSQKLSKFKRFLSSFLQKHHVSDKLGHLSNCYEESEGCNSHFRTLHLLSYHFPSVKYMKDLIYRMNVLFSKLNALDEALDNGNIDSLEEIMNTMKLKGDQICNDKDDMCLDENFLQEEFKDAFLAFTKRSLDTPSYMCISCQKLCYQREVRSISNLKIPLDLNPNWQKLISFYVTNYDNGLIYGKPVHEYDSICEYCLNHFRKMEVPSTCVLNNLYAEEIPEELRNLNYYEKILIQRAKAFQVVQRAGTVTNKKLPHRSRLQKMKGRTFYLPLPLEETLNKICATNDPVNKNHELYILVRGIPTKANIVWENLVNVNRVFEALLKLREINPLYFDIKLPKSAKDLISLVSEKDVEFAIDDETSELNDANENDKTNRKPALLTQILHEELYENYTIHPMHDQRLNATSTKLYQMLKVRETPLSFHLKNLDLLCFPDLYPHGRNGLHEERQVRLTDATYIRTRLCSVDPRFRLNQQYLFFLQHDAWTRQINSGIYHLLNITNPKERLNAKECIEKLERGDLEGRLDTIFERVRNSEQYWRIPRNNLNCMIQHYGPATWFLTISPAEWLWDDLIHYLRTVNSPMGDKLSADELIASDPVSVSRFVDNKFHAILDFLLSSSNPIGKIIHYFWRREYQSRGMIHFHLVIWIENAPIIGINTNEEIIEFIKKYVSCTIPSKSRSPTLYRRVTTHQNHHHNSYCLRQKKVQGKISKVCRFGFSRPITDTFVLRNTAVSVAGRKNLKTKCRLYDLPRTKEEENINDYNPAVLSVWEGNMDIQFIGEKSGLLTVYCTKYASKPEVAGTDFETINDINRTKTVRQLLWNIAFRSLNHREVGALEITDTLLGMPLYGTDPHTVIRWLDVRQIRNKRLKSRQQIEALDPESSNIFYDSFIDDYYPARPKELESLSLYDFAKWYDVISTKPVQKHIQYFNLSNGKYLRKRRTEYLINHYKYNPKIVPENYYFSLLLLFKPWRDTDELKGTFTTYTESFMHHKDELLEAFQYHERLEEIQKGFDEIREKIEKETGKEKNNDANSDDDDDDEVLLGCDPVEAEAAMHDFHDLNNKVEADVIDLPALMSKMNVDQIRVFEKVKKALITKDEILRLYVSGEGGTGKSFLIDVIQRWVRQETSYQVAIAAPTGLAAFNVNGLTIHKLLQLPVEHDSAILKYRQLSDKALKVLRENLKNVGLIIIDEISMVSNLTFLYMNFRLNEIFNSGVEEDNGWFGGKHILLFGDLLQLPPVRASPTYVPLTKSEMERHVGSSAVFDLWTNLFSYDELTIKMRQRTDTCYGDILSRLRMGATTREDIAVLETRKMEHNGALNYEERLVRICKYINDLPPDTVCLLATCKNCEILNDHMLKQIDSNEIVLNAMDEYSGPKIYEKKASKLLEKYEDDASETAGLLRAIKIKIGAKIMIRRNIDITLGLVNGTIATVQSVSKFLNSEEVEYVTVRLSSEHDCKIERVVAKIQVVDSAFVVRRQFPICLSYGITIHKSQGLSLNNAIIDVGNTVFTHGQTYVALSRLKTLSGLHLINFDPHAMTVNLKAIGEYNRLRSSYRPELPQYDVPEKRWQKVFDFIWAVQEYNLADNIRDEFVENSSDWQLRRFLRSNETLSYADTTIQALFNCPSIRKELQQRENLKNSELSLLLKEYIEGENDLECLGIRNHAGDTFESDNPQDPTEFIMALCSKNEILRELLHHELHVHNTCTTCTYTGFYKTVQCILLCDLDALETHMTFRDMFSTLFNRKEDGGYCLNCGDMRKLLTKTELVSASNIMILQLTNPTKNIRISSVPTTKLVICGENYQVMGAILYCNTKKSSHHYMNFLRFNTSDWMAINDHEMKKSRWPSGSKNVYLLFLEKCIAKKPKQTRKGKVG